MASEHPTTASRPIRVRRATIEDKDRWVITHNSGYELDRQFTWRYPKRKEYQEDSINSCVRVFVEQLLPNTENDNIVPTVAEIKKETEGSNEPEWKVIGIAVWERKLWEDVEKEATPLTFSKPTAVRRDLDPVHQKIFVDMINAAEKDFIGAEWGKERLDLVDMVVHADYHRHGAGKALMEYGLNIARERHVPITLTASFLGHFLYLHMGFQELGYVECGEEGDDEKIGMWVMVWTPEGWEKPQA